MQNRDCGFWFQIEGAYLEDGKGLNNWDVFTHTHYYFYYGTDDNIVECNHESYEQRLMKKFEKGELMLLKKGKFTCPFCPNKIKLGDRKSLEMHTLDLRDVAKKMQDGADHQVLALLLLGDDLPPYGRPSKKVRFI
ncbi:hypothetical protein ACQ4PT_045397 [Festuca glaucescens]